MLLQFIVKNFLSFKDETVFSLLPTSKQKHDEHIMEQEVGKNVKALPVAAIYGANASGKSNLVRAISFAQDLVVSGSARGQLMGRNCFKLDKQCKKLPSSFEFFFTCKGMLYTFSFSITDTEVINEQLFAYFSSRPSLMYERITQNGKVEVDYGDNIAVGKKERELLRVIEYGTLPNQLFLSETFKKPFSRLGPVSEWFQEKLRIIHPEAYYPALHLHLHSDPSFKRLCESVLRVADTGISKISTSETPYDLEVHLNGIPSEHKDKLIADLRKSPEQGLALPDESGRKDYVLYDPDSASFKSVKVNAIHRMNDGTEANFELDEESDGTIRWMNLTPILSIAKQKDRTFIVDELDRSLHPLLCRYFVRLFLRLNIQFSNSSQLIFTTHDTNLLDLELLRRDEIYFAEKDSLGASHLTSLAEYKVRKDLKIDRGYLNGRFGAIPLLADQLSHLELIENE